MTISKTITAAVLACGLAFTASTGASAAGTSALSGLKAAAPQSAVIDVRGGRHYGGRRSHRGRNIGLGILGAAAAAAIISGAASAHRRRGRDSCDYLDYKCSQGHGWACRKFDYRCN